ncbi:MAG TPA: DUF222 domain-containing protein [Microbacterium sp.]|uniref:HNH endonuclease signature motif containing protein n=1 Tax=Microbacterium sp. TaxID=51671 RepID=UPI002CE70FEC|nr:DUF222 domain-containing protein [Microbacterium sp.]HWI30312.1 DUF222 domain-containing protein [Microbacterium sp.]
MSSPSIDALSEDDGRPPATRDALTVVTGVLDDVVADRMETNRRAARLAAGIVDAIALARRNPFIFTELTGGPASEIAERAVILDVALRLQVTEHEVRNLAHVAETAQQNLPWLWRRALDGFALFSLLETTVTGLLRLAVREDADAEERAAAAEARAIVDAATSEWVVTCTPATFRRRLNTLLDRLDPRSADVRHADALQRRRVMVEDAGDGMAWLSAYLPTIDALAIKRRLTSTAKHVQKDPRETRTRDQIRADLLGAWLRGDGTPTAVRTKIFVTIPVALLAGASTDGDRCGMCGGTAEQARLVGHGPVDPLTAKQLFLDAKAFHRVITDPVRSVILDVDRRSYRPTTAQRDHLILTHGTCARDGCTRLALDADIDHDRPWAHGGLTNARNLRPLCPPDHAARHGTTFAYRSRSDGSVEVTTPTGHVTTQPPPF